LLHDRGIQVKVSIIIGFPGETKETLKKTKNVLKKCNFDEIMIHGLSVLSGTPLYENRQEFGIKLTPYGWAHGTMRTIDLPRHIRDMIIFLTKQTDTSILNISQNVTPKFFQSNVTENRIKKGTKIIQSILCHEWENYRDNGGEKPCRMTLFEELLKIVDFIPLELYGFEKGNLDMEVS